MKPLLQLVWKDIRLLRGWIALWLVLHLAVDALGFWTAVFAAPADDEAAKAYVASLDPTLAALLFAQGLVAFCLCVLTVQADRPVGPSFWRTRPISAGRLTAAKIIVLVFLLLILPFVALLPWWIHCGLPLEQMGPAFLPTVRMTVFVAIPALFVAAAANSIARSFLWGLVAVPVYAVFILGVADGPTFGTRPASFSLLSILTPLVLALVLVFGRKHVRRGFAAPVAILLFGMAFTLGLTRYWAAIDEWRDHGPTAAIPATGPTVRIKHARIALERRDEATVTLVVAPDTPPAGTVAIPRAVTLGLPTTEPHLERVPGYGAYSSDDFLAAEAISAAGLQLPARDAETEQHLTAARAEFDRRRREQGRQPAAFSSEPFGPGSLFSFTYPRPVLQEWRGSAMPAQAEIAITLVRPELACTTRLDSREWNARRGLGLRVVHLKADPTAVRLLTLESHQSRRRRYLKAGVVLDQERQVTRPLSGWNIARIAIGGVEMVYRRYAYGEAVVRQGKWQHVPAMELQQRTLARFAEQVVGAYGVRVEVPRPPFPE